jgi:hypothetical protein
LTFFSFWLLLLDNVTFFVLFLTKIHFFELSFQGIQVETRFDSLAQAKQDGYLILSKKAKFSMYRVFCEMRFLDKMHEKSQICLLGVFEVCFEEFL